MLQVVGPLHQSLVLEWKHSQRGDETARALFNFIFHSRAIIIAGTWDGNLDEYVEHGTDFTAILKRSRFYRSTKQTPIHRCGDEDAQANAEQLIGNPSRRGRKVSRRIIRATFRQPGCRYKKIFQMKFLQHSHPRMGLP